MTKNAEERPSLHGVQTRALALESGLDAPKAPRHSARLIEKIGRLAQRESTAFTRQGSLVQSQYRPPFFGSTELLSEKEVARINHGCGLTDKPEPVGRIVPPDESTKRPR